MKKILVVEDEAPLQEALGEALSQAGFKVIRALEGDAAVRLAKSELPDLILLDLMLPNKDGFEILEEIKKNSSTEKIPVIILTNLEGIKDVDKAISAGATTYLVKTHYRITEIIDKVKQTLA